MKKKIKILFIGEIISSHAQSWIQLLKNQKGFEVLILDIGADWDREQFDFQVIFFRSKFRLLKLTRYFPFKSFKFLYYKKSLAACNQFKPDIVHTLGLFPAAFHYLETPYKFKSSAKWFAQVRGGPDLAMNRHDSQKLPKIHEVFLRCHKLIADNHRNYQYAQELGLSPEKIAFENVIPGTGGIDIPAFDRTPLPSQKAPLILWPKAYNCIQSDGFVVIEGLRRALEKLSVRVHLVATAATPEVVYWIKRMLPENSCSLDIYDRIPRDIMLSLYHNARVLLAPSLSDGIPNTLYEAMAFHAVPIVSPLETLTPIFKDKKHVLYAKNLDPEEISQAVIEAITNDKIADQIALTNREFVVQLADRNKIRHQVIEWYQNSV